jgi:hypothetical protein
MTVDARTQIQHILAKGPQPEAVEVLFDLLEENGMDPWLVEFAASEAAASELLEEDGYGRVIVTGLARLLGALAQLNYPRAVELLNGIEFPKNDYRSRHALIDAINTAHCVLDSSPHHLKRMGPTWEDRLRYEKMEQVTDETGVELGPWEGITEVDGEPPRYPVDATETSRAWTTDYPPDGLSGEFEREWGYGTFATVYDGGDNYSLRDKSGLWRRVLSGGAGREAECPWIGSDEGDLVNLQSTYCGENPGKECALCEEPLGEPHGIIYLGEFNLEVFMLDVMADVDTLEVQEGRHDWWKVVAFAGEEEVEIPELALVPTIENAGAYREEHGVVTVETGCTDSFDTEVEARAAAIELVARLSRRGRISVR